MKPAEETRLLKAIREYQHAVKCYMVTHTQADSHDVNAANERLNDAMRAAIKNGQRLFGESDDG